uniref:Histone H2B n=1 Tax=Talaromyces marneffei PM1 TaxID=1077442 RepID=A0A093UQ58_TALMA
MESPSKTAPKAKIQHPDDRFTLPGFGLRLDYTPEAMNGYGVRTRSLFPTVLDDRDIEAGYIDQPVVTIREKKMLQLINEFTDKQDWFEKVFDACYIQVWTKELREDPEVTENMIDWLTAELKYKAKIARKIGFINVFNADVVKSCADFFQHEKFRTELCNAIKKLEQGLGTAPEYQMATEEREMDYVHPSFFPVAFGKTRVLPDRLIGLDDAVASMGQGEIIPVPQDPGPSRHELSWNIASRSDIMPRPYSSRFQWLPSDVYFRPDGSSYFASYINNIHPSRDKTLYTVLEKLLDKIIPMWDLTLTPIKSPIHPRARVELQEVRYVEKEPGKTEPKPVETPQEERGDYEERLRFWRRKWFKAVQPEPGEFAPVGIPPEIMNDLPPTEQNKHRLLDLMNLKKEYGHRGLQVTVRIADMAPTPDQPIFEVPWHMEGQINEHLCASSIYFFEMKNIESVRMHFRQISDTQAFSDLNYERGDTIWLEDIFGMKHDESPVQEVGYIECPQGRMITWPNTLQHNVVFTLKDKTQVGHVHAINFMLVDPNIRIISTANVPPQRLDWKPETEEAQKKGIDVRKAPMEEKFKILPREGDFPWVLEEAREILMENTDERKKFNHYQNVAFHSKNISL